MSGEAGFGRAWNWRQSIGHSKECHFECEARKGAAGMGRVGHGKVRQGAKNSR